MSVAQPVNRIMCKNDLIVLAKVSLAGTIALSPEKFGIRHNLESGNAPLGSNLYL
jgi:hypothetical protein